MSSTATPITKMDVDKKQEKSEFKDFSLNADVLLPEFSEDEVAQLFPAPLTKISDTKDEPMIVERFVDAAIEQSQRGKTENRAATYLTSDDARIDFFFQVLEDTQLTTTISLLEKSWNYSCLDTLRLIAYLRDIRSGKSIRYQYYACLYWLYEHHPRTLLQNFPIFLKCGYWKDPLQLLMVILFKGDVPKYLFREEFNTSKTKALIAQKKRLHDNNEDAAQKSPKSARLEVTKVKSNFYRKMYSEFNFKLATHYKEEVNKKYRTLHTKPQVHREYHYAGDELIDEEDDSHQSGNLHPSSDPDCDKASESNEVKVPAVPRDRNANEIDRKHMKEFAIRYARERFNGDKKYRYFHLKFAEMIAKQLIEDAAHLKANNAKQISLAAKWAPSLNGHFDKYSLFASSISLQLAKLTREHDASVDEIFTKPIPIATYLARKNYTKNYIVPLRAQLQIPELYMCSNRWDTLPYKMVPSKCMQRNRKQFIKHDKERFTEFIQSRSKIAGATLKPPELVKRAMNLVNGENENEQLEKELLEKQWNSLKDSIKLDVKETCFKSALAICDTSGSMSGTPMEAAIGLTLMTMSFTSEPWSSICLTFSMEPQFVHFEKNQSLCSKVKQLLETEAGLNTDLTKTFQLILKLAVSYNPEETNIEEARRLFTEAGYELPTIVCWNLRESHSIPIQKNEQGTIMLSGYSAQQLSLLLNLNIDDITPYMFVEEVLSTKKYEDLVVID